MYLSSILKKEGHEVYLKIGASPISAGELERINPDIAAFSVTTGTHLWALQQTGHIKSKSNALIVMGGAHPTYFPEVIEKEGLDVICRGEGENAFRMLAERVEERRSFSDIPNLWVKTEGRIIRNPMAPLIEDLDALPAPDRELYYQYPFLADNPTKNFISGRGCPFNCAYCSMASLKEMYRHKGHFTRFRSAEKTIEEITGVRDRYGLKTVCFQDDTFILKISRLKPFLKLYGEKVRLPFICHVRADLVTDEIVRSLKDAGCHSVDFGVESGNPEIRRKVLKKTISNRQIRDAAGLFHRYDIPIRTTNMLGLPGETIETAFQTVEINQEIRTDYPSCSVYQPYPKTELGDKVISMGMVPKDYNIDNMGSSFYKSSVIQSDSSREFANLQKFFFFAVRFPRLKFIIKKLIKLPPNPFYDYVFLMWYAYNYMGSENISFGRVVRLGLHTFKHFFFGK